MADGDTQAQGAPATRQPVNVTKPNWTEADFNPGGKYFPIMAGDVLDGRKVLKVEIIGDEYVPTWDEPTPPPAWQDKVAGGFNAAAFAAAGNVADSGTSAYLARSESAADILREREARMRQDAQRDYQIASRDPRVEGDKDAAASAASRYQQNMKQISGAAGAGAAALASQETVDPSQFYQQHRERADTQFEKGTALQTEAEQAGYDAEKELQDAEEQDSANKGKITRNRAGADISTGTGSDSRIKNIVKAIHRRF
jgi:hypothetical protein